MQQSWNKQFPNSTSMIFYDLNQGQTCFMGPYERRTRTMMPAPLRNGLSQDFCDGFWAENVHGVHTCHHPTTTFTLDSTEAVFWKFHVRSKETQTAQASAWIIGFTELKRVCFSSPFTVLQSGLGH